MMFCKDAMFEMHITPEKKWIILWTRSIRVAKPSPQKMLILISAFFLIKSIYLRSKVGNCGFRECKINECENEDRYCKWLYWEFIESIWVIKSITDVIISSTIETHHPYTNRWFSICCKKKQQLCCVLDSSIRRPFVEQQSMFQWLRAMAHNEITFN